MAFVRGPMALYFANVNIEIIDADIDQHRFKMQRAITSGCCHISKCRHNHLIPGLQTQVPWRQSSASKPIGNKVLHDGRLNFSRLALKDLTWSPIKLAWTSTSNTASSTLILSFDTVQPGSTICNLTLICFFFCWILIISRSSDAVTWSPGFSFLPVHRIAKPSTCCPIFHFFKFRWAEHSTGDNTSVSAHPARRTYRRSNWCGLQKFARHYSWLPDHKNTATPARSGVNPRSVRVPVLRGYRRNWVWNARPHMAILRCCNTPPKSHGSSVSIRFDSGWPAWPHRIRKAGEDCAVCAMPAHLLKADPPSQILETGNCRANLDCFEPIPMCTMSIGARNYSARGWRSLFIKLMRGQVGVGCVFASSAPRRSIS